MKHFIILLMLLIGIGTTYAQSIPKGMNYQAVARDLKGNVLSNQDIDLKIELTSLQSGSEVVYYSEVHKVTTNQLGLFTLIIGEGKSSSAGYEKIPWSTEDIFMNVSIVDKSTNAFTTISSSKLLAVPYAYHAVTAEQLLGDEGLEERAVKEEYWMLRGNFTAGQPKPKFGTNDCADIMIITNNIERMRIFCDGNITMENSLLVKKDLSTDHNLKVSNNAVIWKNLTAKGNVVLNLPLGPSKDSLSSTLNHGSFTVANTSFTYLTGTLTVDGITNLNSALNVNNGSPTFLSGTLTVDKNTWLKSKLRVDKSTNLNDSLSVNNMAPTYLSGKLTVDKNTWLKSKLRVDLGTNLNDSLSVNNIAPTYLTGKLTVDKNTWLKSKLRVDLSTNLNDSLSVNNIAPTYLTGKLTVDKNTWLKNKLRVDLSTNLNDSLSVNNVKPTYLTGKLTVDQPTWLKNTLVVDDVTNLNSALNVNNVSPTLLTGVLQVNKKATFKDQVLLDNASFQSTGVNSGALVVAGGVGIGGNLYLDGEFHANGPVLFGAALDVQGPVTLSDKLTVHKKVHFLDQLEVDKDAVFHDNLLVDDNVEINHDLKVNNDTNLLGKLDVDKATDLNMTLNVDGNTTLKSNLTVDQSTTLKQILSVDGATDLNSTLNVDGNTTLKAKLTVDGATDLNTTLNVDGATTLNSDLSVLGTANLKAINANGQMTITADVDGADTDKNSYPLRVQGTQGIAITVDGARTGANNFVTFWDANGAQGRIEGQNAADLLNDPEYIFQDALYIAEVAAAAVNVGLSLLPNGCAGVGVVACPPEPSVVAITLAEAAIAAANLIGYEEFADANLGVTYQSGSADYAEWLEKGTTGEVFTPGDIVAVDGGKISKRGTITASQCLVISTNPAILGNMQSPENQANFEKVAFMGQVPVKVRGLVNKGDYILPSGYNDGIGVGVAPHLITAKQYQQIVGVAWSSTTGKAGISFVNTAVGLNTNAISDLFKQQENINKQLESKLASLEERMNALESGKTNSVAGQTKLNGGNVALISEEQTSNIIYTIDTEKVEEAIMLLKNTYEMNGLTPRAKTAISKLFNDKAYRTEVIKNVQENYIAAQKGIINTSKH